MEIHNFSRCKKSNIDYGGSEKKLGIVFEGKNYMLKFPKNSPFGKRNNTISEYLGSHIYKLLGFDVQNTLLGTYKGEYVVACEDFVFDNVQFVSFNDVGESSLDVDREKYQYSYEDILILLIANNKIPQVSGIIETFFKIYIVDALLGNFDRHGGNWGFLKENNQYRLAPVFDNGSCLFPNLNDEETMKNIVNNQEEIDRRVYEFPTSQLKLKGKKSSYYEVISSLEYGDVCKALLDIYPKINLEEINKLIDGIDIISNIHKQFYKVMIKNRYEKIIKYSYDKLVGD